MAVDGRGADAVAVRGVSQSRSRVAACLLAAVDATSRDRSREQPEVAGAANCGRRRRPDYVRAADRRGLWPYRRVVVSSYARRKRLESGRDADGTAVSDRLMSDFGSSPCY